MLQRGRKCSLAAVLALAASVFTPAVYAQQVGDCTELEAAPEIYGRVLYGSGGSAVTGTLAQVALYLVALPIEERPLWSLCLDRKPLSELGPVSAECLASPQSQPKVRESLGRGEEVEAVLPEDACQRFGPQRPDPKPGEPSGRPVDPDPTGGFYQPVVAWLDDSAALGAARIACAIRDATFTRRYKRNHNPELSAFDVLRADGSVIESNANEPISLRRGEAVNLRARWPACPSSDACGDGFCGIDEDAITCADDCSQPQGCAGAERYARFDPLSQGTAVKIESLVVAWFATAGRFDAPRTDRVGAAGGDAEPGTLNRYVAPSAGEATLWAVVRDDRGGVSWLERSVVLTE